MIRRITVFSLIGIFALLFPACDGDSGPVEEMAEEHKNDRPVSNEASSSEPEQPVETRTVQYATVQETEVTGYLAQPKETGEKPLPGLIVIHEWWGLNDQIRSMTRRLAGQGYSALAVDLYRGQTADSPDQAKSLMNKAMERKDQGKQNVRQAYRYLSNESGAKSVGVIGWCFGGGWSLRTALTLPEKIDATVIYYGHLVTDKKQLSALKMPILGHFGSEDDAISPSDVRAFSSALESLGKTADIHLYEGANHAFANPSGERYDPDAAKKAWKRTVRFLEKHLKN